MKLDVALCQQADGVDRILTTGQGASALEGPVLIAALAERAADRVISHLTNPS